MIMKLKILLLLCGIAILSSGCAIVPVESSIYYGPAVYVSPVPIWYYPYHRPYFPPPHYYHYGPRR